MDNVVLIGTSGHAKVVIDIVEQEGRYRIVGLMDHHGRMGEKIFGYPMLGDDSRLPALMVEYDLKGVIVAIGDNTRRGTVADGILALCPGLPLVSAVHPGAWIGKETNIAQGSVIMAGAVINPCCQIGIGCMVNTKASLDHDGVMEAFSSLAPNVTTGGECRIGRYSAIGIGAIVSHGIRIGEHSVIGAGSLVLQDVAPFSVAYGSPAKKIRDRQKGDRYL